MKEELALKINSLSLNNQRSFYERLYNVLDDRLSCILYGLTKSDYVSLPKEKVERVEEKLYNEMFEIKKNKN
jgi:hypothetical protein